MRLTTKLPYGPIVRGDQFSFTTFTLEWHTFGEECDACEPQYRGDEEEPYPRRLCPCGGLVHHQILGPYMGDQANGVEEGWMCEECGKIGRDDWEDFEGIRHIWEWDKVDA